MPPTSQPIDNTSRTPQKPGRHDARKFIAPVRATMREAFSNTGDSDQVSRYFDASIGSTRDVVASGHDADIKDHGARLAAIESRLGLRKPMGVARGLALVRRAS